MFGRGGDDYHLFVLCGIVSWQFFARSLNSSVRAISQNAALIKQIGMPVSLLVAIPSLVQMFFAVIGILIVMLWNYQAVGIHSLAVILLLPLIGFFAFGLGTILAVCEVFFKDTTKLVAYAIRAGFFFSPILYPESRVLESDRIPEILKHVFELNPMAWIIPSFRKILLDGVSIDWNKYGIFLIVSLIMIQLGLYLLRENSNKIVKTL